MMSEEGLSATELAGMSACVEALVLGGARIDAGVSSSYISGSSSTAGSFSGSASGLPSLIETSNTLLQVAKAAAAKLKATKTVPSLQPVPNSRLSSMVHAQLGAQWVEDSKVSSCMSCGVTFATTIRRHHCRLLGLVVCDSCSTKRVILPGQGSSGVRVCDAAYNMVLYLGRLAIEYDQHDEVAKRARAAKAKQEEVARVEEAKKELLQKAQERRSATTNSSTSPAVSSTRRSTGGSSSASSSSAAAAAAARSTSGAAKSAASEAMNALHERGEKLGVLGDKIADLGDEAEQFHDMARKIRMQAEKQSKWLPF